MKIEFIVADVTGVWRTKIVDVPNGETDGSEFEIQGWAIRHVDLFSGDVAFLGVYNTNPEENESSCWPLDS